jgi:hypothetical protein
MPILKMPIEKLWGAIGISDPQESDESAQDYAAEATSSFLKEWATNEMEEGQEPWELIEAAEDAVREKVWDNVSGSVWRHIKNEIESAIEAAAEQAMSATNSPGAIGKIEIGKRGTFTIEIGKPFLKMWRAAVEGEGYAAWGGDEKLSDVSASRVLSVLDNIAEVYGGGDIARKYENSQRGDRFEPDTGSYSELAKVADKALKDSKRKKR